MHLKTFIKHALLCSTVPLCSANLIAATEFEDSVPLDLVRALLPGLPASQAVVYRDIPDAFPIKGFPDDFEVVGGAAQGYGTVVVLQTTLDQQAMDNTMRDHLLSSGWLNMPLFSPSNTRTGFVTAEAASVSFQFCRDDVPGMLNFSHTWNGRTNMEVLTHTITPRQFNNGRPQPSCTDQIAQQEENASRAFRRGGNILQEYMPRMELPQADDPRNVDSLYARVSSGGRGSSNDWETSSGITLDWPMQQLFDHFSEQISAQQWERETALLDEILATGVWRKSVGSDQELMGILTITAMEDEVFELKFRIIRTAGADPNAPALGIRGIRVTP